MDQKRTKTFITELENALGKTNIDANGVLTIGETIKFKDVIMLFSSVQTQGVYFCQVYQEKGTISWSFRTFRKFTYTW